MSDSDGLIILEDRAIKGLSEVIEDEPSASAQRQVELATQAAREQPAGAQGARSLQDFWQSVIQTILGRRVREVLGPFEVPAPWFSFHVPQAAKGQLKVATKSGSEFGLKIKAAGSGWGSGRSVTMTVNRDFQERVRCIRVALSLKTRVTIYEDDAPPRADVLSVAGVVVSELDTCPDCSGANERAGAMVEPAGEWIDHLRDTVGETIETTTEFVDTHDVSLSLPFKVPGVKVEIGINCSRRASLTCIVKYLLPGGHRYRPCVTVNEPEYLPYWRQE